MKRNNISRPPKNFHLVITSIVIGCIGILSVSGWSSSDPQQSEKEEKVENKTSSLAVNRVQKSNRSVRLSLMNSCNKNITAFAVSKGNATIKVDLAVSDEKIAPGAVYEFEFPMQSQPSNSTQSNSLEPAIIVQAALFEDRSYDGNPKIAAEITEGRVAQKIQLANIISLLERTVKSSIPKTTRTLQVLRGEIAALPDGSDGDLSLTTRSGLSAEKEMAIRELQKLEESPQLLDQAAILNSLRRMREYYKDLVSKL